ncbi:MAG: hypothetical protein AB1898_17400 [Acidobacteriota bacterium]
MDLVETPGYDHSAEDEVKPEARREPKWRATLNLVEPTKPTKGRKGSIVRTGLPIDKGKLGQQAVEAAVGLGDGELRKNLATA